MRQADWICSVFLAAAGTCAATTYTWTGTAGDGLFSTPGNWQDGVAPVAATDADSLVFDTAGAATNDIANLTVGDVAVTLSAGAELTLGGERKIGGSGTFTLGGDGTGTLVFDVTGGLDAQPIVIDAGVFKVGDSLTGSALGSSADTAPITVKSGGTLDVNYPFTTIDYGRCQVTHDKLIRIAGAGAPGAGGAIVNSNKSGSNWPPQLGDVVLTADATIGPKRIDFGTLVNGSTTYGARATHASITGDYVLTFADTDPGKAIYRGIRRCTVNLKSITVTNGVELLIGENTAVTLSDNVLRLVSGGKICCSGQSSGLHFPSSISVAGGDNRIRCSNGTGYFDGAITISADADLALSQGNLHFYGKITGDPVVTYTDETYCNAYFKGGVDGVVTFKGASGKACGRPIFDTANSSFYGAFLTTGEATIDGRTGEIVRNGGNVFTGYPLDRAYGVTVNNQDNFGVYGIDLNDHVLISNSTISVNGNFTAGRLSPRSNGNKIVMRLGEGANVTAKNVYTGNNVWPNHGAIEVLSGAVLNATNSLCVGFHDGQKIPAKGPTNEWLTVDGGTVNAPKVTIGCGYYAPQSRIYLKSGSITAKGVCLQGYEPAAGNGLVKGDVRYGGGNTYRFAMTGGTLNLGSRGFKQYGREENSEANVILSGGTLNMTADFTLTYYIPTLFGTWRDREAGGFTWNTAGRTATVRTALNGMADVTITGGGTFDGTNAMQGVLGGKWTVEAGTTADLSGAASFLGGLSAGANANVTLDVGAGRSAAFFSRDGSAPLTAACASTNILARFNKSDGGTVSSQISHDLWLWNVSGTSAGTSIPNYAGGEHEALVAKGEFYVAEDEAGTWTFSGIYGTRIYIQIDDVSATSANSTSYAHLEVPLTAGWHRFVVICEHESDAFGPTGRPGMMLGFAKTAVSGNAAADYTIFSPKNLKMRPNSPFGGEATVRWSTVKGKK